MLPLNASKNFALLADQYRDRAIEFPLLKGVTLAQWAMESGWGNTKLADTFLNFGGMKWGQVDAMFGYPVMYGSERYTGFSSLTSFIDGYWHRLDNVNVFEGWRANTDDPEAFISFVTMPWVTGRSPELPLNRAEKSYVRDIMDIRQRRTEECFRASE